MLLFSGRKVGAVKGWKYLMGWDLNTIFKKMRSRVTGVFWVSDFGHMGRHAHGFRMRRRSRGGPAGKRTRGQD